MNALGKLVCVIILINMAVVSASMDGCYTDLGKGGYYNVYSKEDIKKVRNGELEIPMLACVSDGGNEAVIDLSNTEEFNDIPPISTTVIRQEEYDEKVEPNNPVVRAKALEIASEYPGSYSIEQVFAIANYVNSEWRYVNDPSNTEYINSASESIEIGKKSGCAGVGDCEDAAVLVASLIEAIGGRTRIIHSCGDDGCHAYAEVFLGNMVFNSIIDVMFKMMEENPDLYFKLFYHVNFDSHNIWMNLEGSNKHPGGKFASGDSGIINWEGSGSKAPEVAGGLDPSE